MKTRARSWIGILVLAAGIGSGSASLAAGLDLSWDDCGIYGNTQKDFTCDTNSGGATLVVSASPPVTLNQFVGAAMLVQLATNQPAISPWWDFTATGCHGSTRLTFSADFTSGPSNCDDVFAGQGVGAIGSYTLAFDGAPYHARINAAVAIPGSTTLAAGTEAYLGKLSISYAKTVGVGACAGCTDGVCIMLTRVQLSQSPGVGDYIVTVPIYRNWVIWQPGGLFVSGGGCPGVFTAARASTWGGVKALYR